MTTPNQQHGTGKRPAWREPMVWLVFAIPAAAVIASIALLVTASRSTGTDDAVADKVQRTAQVQVADLGPDAMARQLRLSAVVRFSDARGEKLIEVLPVDGGFDRKATLSLALHHPSRAELDRTIALVPAKTGWRSEGELDLVARLECATHPFWWRLAPAGTLDVGPAGGLPASGARGRVKRDGCPACHAWHRSPLRSGLASPPPHASIAAKPSPTRPRACSSMGDCATSAAMVARRQRSGSATRTWTTTTACAANRPLAYPPATMTWRCGIAMKSWPNTHGRSRAAASSPS